ncbi:putative protein DUF1016 [Aromatoleum bremense]|nr:putative protein DUF1016 [Aromatoleum bremense]
MDRLGERLAQEFGRGFEPKNLRRMVQFTQAFPDPEKVASLMRQLSWTHFLQLLPLKTEPARHFYAGQCMAERWSVRELHRQIERKAFERSEIAGAQGTALTAPSADETAPAVVFKAPYFLDFLGLRQGHDEADLETAILRQLEAFIQACNDRIAAIPALLKRFRQTVLSAAISGKLTDDWRIAEAECDQIEGA